MLPLDVYTVATDRVTGEVLKVDVTVRVLKVGRIRVAVPPSVCRRSFGAVDDEKLHRAAP